MLKNKRVAYTDNELSLLFKKVMKENRDTKEDIYMKYREKYDLEDMSIIQDMLSGVVFYDVTMLQIASNYLGISYDDLTKIIVDEDNLSYRKDGEDKNLDALVDILNMLFTSSINQEKLNKKL